MKHKIVWVRALLLALCAVFVLSCLAGCATKKNIAELNQELEELKGKLNETTQKADEAETKASVAQLRALVDEIKKTADGAATAAKLEEVVNTLSKAATKEALDAAVADVEALIKENADADAEVKTALEAVETTLQAAATKAELGEVSAAVDQAIEDCGTMITALQTSLEGKITELNGKFNDLSAKVTGNETALQALKTEMEAVKLKLQNLEDSKDDFQKNYQEATKLLKSDDEKYSLAAFEAKVALYKEDQSKYDGESFDEFVKEADRIHFYLVRATSVAEIKALIDGDFADIVTNIEANDLTKNFPALLESLKGNVTAETDLKQVISVWATLPEDAQEDNKEEYEALLAAKAELVKAAEAAAEVKEAIDAVGTVIYGTSEEAVAACREAVDEIQATYFTAVAEENAAAYAYYKTDMTAADMVENYATLEAMEDRVIELAEAFEKIVELIDVAKNFNDARPLYTDRADLDLNVANVNLWIETYSLEDENVAALYAAKYESEDVYPLLAAAQTYAAAMDDLYTAYLDTEKDSYGENANFQTAIAALKAKVDDNTLTLGNDEKLFDALAADLNALAEDITKVEAYDKELDSNYNAMFTVVEEDYTAVAARVGALNNVKTHLTELKAQMDEIKEVAFTHYNDINNFRHDMNDTYEANNIQAPVVNKEGETVVEGDANYVELATEAEARWLELRTAYENLTAEIAVIYNDAMELLAAFRDVNGNLVLDLCNGNKLIDVLAKLKTIVIDKGLTEVVLPLPSGDTNADIKDLYDEFIYIATEFNKKAAAAQDAAVAVNNAINALPDDAMYALNLNNYTTINNAYNAVVEWYIAYIDADFDKTASDAQATIAAELSKISGKNKIEIFDGNDTQEFYDFVTAINYDFVKTRYNDAEATYAAAKEASEPLKNSMNALIEEWNVHSDFATVQTSYNSFITKYYNKNLVEASDFFAVLPVYTEFTANQKDYNAACTITKEKADFINSLIAKLKTGVIDFSEAEGILDDIAVIYDLIADFYENGSHCEAPCDQCIAKYFTINGVNNLNKLYNIMKRAEMTKAYGEVYATADEATQEKILTAKASFDSMFNNATSMTISDTVYKTAMNKLETFKPVAPETPETPETSDEP